MSENEITLTPETLKKVKAKVKSDLVQELMSKETARQLDIKTEAKKSALKAYIDDLTSRFFKIELVQASESLEEIDVKFYLAPKKKAIKWKFYWECVDSDKLHEIISRPKSRARTK